jgi:HflK protein
VLTAAWDILVDSALFLLLGYVLAGLIQALLAGRSLTRWIAQPGFRSVSLATVVGLPLPLCSCSVLPTALTLRRQGASGGATLAFLASTPETSVTSIALTYALMGPWWAILRPIAALLSALTVGMLEDWREQRSERTEPAQKNQPAQENQPVQGTQTQSDCACPSDDEPATKSTFIDQLRASWRRAFGDLFDDLFVWIMVGIAFAAAIQVLLPPDWLLTILGGTWQSMLVMALIGVPLYVCAEASTPIAAAFLLAGVNPGAALVFLLVGPATNLGALGVLQRELGWRSAVVYLTGVLVVAFVVGAVVDQLYYSTFATAVRDAAAGGAAIPEVVNQLAAILFLVIGIESLRRTAAVAKCADWCRAKFGIPLNGPMLATLMLLVVISGYGFSGLFIVRQGEVGIVQRFGKVTQSDLQPGLHLAWPYPIEQSLVVPVSAVRRELIGAIPRDPNGTERTPDGWVLVGDENIVDLQFSVHWRPEADSADAYAFSVRQPRQIVRSAATAAIREYLGALAVHHVLTDQRGRIETELREMIQTRLADYGSGIRIAGVQLLYGHAPPEVHESFRDVASALEDRTTQINQAKAFEAQLVPLARGEAATQQFAAEAYASQILHESRGDAVRFNLLREVFEQSPDITALRLELEMLEKVLPGMWKYIKPPQMPQTQVEFWFMPSDAQPVPPWAPPRTPAEPR